MVYKMLSEFISITENVTIKEVLKFLDKSKTKILFVVDKDKKLIGTVTDGDIRRFLYSAEPDLNKLVFTIMNKNPKYLLETEFRKSSEKDLLVYGINQLPILDEHFKIKSIIEFNINFDLKQKYDNVVIIMAGGKGDRLSPLTKVIPKPLIPFKDKTIIENILDNFCNCGFENFCISVNYKKDLIKQYFKDLKYNVNFLEEPEFLGTAGSIGLLRNTKISLPFFVSNCDVLFDLNFSEVLNYHNKENADITIVAEVKNINIGYGVLTVDKEGSFLEVNEKPNYQFLINSGLYILNPKIIDLIAINEKIDMTDLITRAKAKNFKVKIFPTSKEVLDIGQWKYYKEYIDLL